MGAKQRERVKEAIKLKLILVLSLHSKYIINVAIEVHTHEKCATPALVIQ